MMKKSLFMVCHTTQTAPSDLGIAAQYLAGKLQNGPRM
jgi:hypothetical protein